MMASRSSRFSAAFVAFSFLLLLHRSSAFRAVISEQVQCLRPYFSGLGSRAGSVAPYAASKTTCHLFFRKTQQETERLILRRICDDLTSSVSLCLPYETILGTHPHPSTQPALPQQTNERLTIRLVQPQDLHVVADMCVQEYDSGPSAFPFNNVKLIPAWLDRQALYNLVYWTTFVKSLPQQPNRRQSNSKSNSSIPNDHAVLVGCINDRVVSMVEVSQQPVVPNRNPPVYPLPLSWKRLYSQWSLPSGQQQQQQQSASELQGWLCNLLVVPGYRGRGLSKLLVAACEGVARHEWQCSFMYLHCDADARGDGRVPQQLYERLQYQRVPLSPYSAKDAPQQRQSSRTISWSSSLSIPARIDGRVIVDGVPLLYLRKDLTSLQ